MAKVKFIDYFNEANIVDLGYGYMGCFLMWLSGTSDICAIDNIVEAAKKRLFKENNK